MVIKWLRIELRKFVIDTVSEAMRRNNIEGQVDGSKLGEYVAREADRAVEKRLAFIKAEAKEKRRKK